MNKENYFRVFQESVNDILNENKQKSKTDDTNVVSEAEEKNDGEYKKYFCKILKKYGADSVDDLSDEDKKKFFNEIESGWKAKDESIVKEDAKDGDNDDPTEDETKEEDDVDVDVEKEDDDELEEKFIDVVTIDEKKFGVSQGTLNAFRKGADITIKKVCPKCGFALPVFSGRYPKNCPLCGTEFEPEMPVEEKYAAFVDNKCVGILVKLPEKKIDEGKFKEQEIDIQDIVNHFVDLRKSGKIKTKKQFQNIFNDIPNGKNIPKGIDPKTIKANIARIAKDIASAYSKEGLEF